MSIQRTSALNGPPAGRRVLLGVRLGAVLLALAIAAAVLVTASRGAFTATTENPGNSWAAGTVTITDDDAGVAMFSATGLAPGSPLVNCIAVTYTGSIVPADVSLYGTAGGTGLAPFLDLKIEIGTGGGFGNCDGFTESSTLFDDTLTAFATTKTDFDSGLGGWSPSATNQSRTYRFTVEVQDDNAAQGLTATATFTWEAQNQ